VVPVPGPSALLAALVASGFATRPFAFAGFLPRKGAERARELAQLAAFPGTLVLYEAPNRAEKTLRDLHAVLGPRRVALARELTKRHETVTRGVLGAVVLDDLRGELAIVIDGPAGTAAAETASEAEIDAELARLRAAGHSARDTARELAARFGLSRRDAYARVIKR
jgi:16S rRNA (cytidine1402-2'-O)-methyltransferase